MDSDQITEGIATWGRDFRYVLTLCLKAYGPLDLAELVSAMRAEGWAIRGRPSKTVSDALRWEIARGRAVRLGRGRYGPGSIPRSTEWRIRKRVAAIRAAAADRPVEG